MFKYLLILIPISFCSCNKQDLKKNGCGSPTLLYYDGVNSITAYNVFTPNNDGYNDIFNPIPTSPNLENYKLEVTKGSRTYFSTESPDKSWDGLKDNGKEAKEGVYEYVIQGNFNGTILYFKRTVTLVRGRYGPYHYLGDCAVPYDPIL